MKKALLLVALVGLAACAEKKPATPAADSTMAAPAAAMPADTTKKMGDSGMMMKKDTGMKMAPATPAPAKK